MKLMKDQDLYEEIKVKLLSDQEMINVAKDSALRRKKEILKEQEQKLK